MLTSVNVFHAILFLCFGFIFTLASIAQATGSQPITPEEAAAIVKAEEEANEAAKDACEAELIAEAADALNTTVIYQGGKKIIFNELPSRDPQLSDPPTNSSASAQSNDEFSDKPLVHFSLSGEVGDDGISEIWWSYMGVSYAIHTKMNFLYLTGISSFEDQDTRYSTFMFVTPGNARASPEKWRPALDEFPQDELEYFLIEGDDNPEAFQCIEAMMHYYAANKDELKIKYENAQKLRAAREEYLKSNPPKKRDVILNYVK